MQYKTTKHWNSFWSHCISVSSMSTFLLRQQPIVSSCDPIIHHSISFHNFLSVGPCTWFNTINTMSSVLCIPKLELHEYRWFLVHPCLLDFVSSFHLKRIDLCLCLFDYKRLYLLEPLHLQEVLLIVIVQLLHSLCNQIPSSTHSSVVWGHIEFLRASLKVDSKRRPAGPEL